MISYFQFSNTQYDCDMNEYPHTRRCKLLCVLLFIDFYTLCLSNFPAATPLSPPVPATSFKGKTWFKDGGQVCESASSDTTTCCSISPLQLSYKPHPVKPPTNVISKMCCVALNILKVLLPNQLPLLATVQL